MINLVNPTPFIVSASTTNTSHNGVMTANRAFDGLRNNHNENAWASVHTGTPATPSELDEWLQIDLRVEHTVISVKRFAVVNRWGSVIDARWVGSPRTFTLQGSHNGTDWVVLHTVVGRSNIALNGRDEYELSEWANYRFYRLHFTETNSGGFICLSQFELWGNRILFVPIRPGMTSNTAPSPFVASASSSVDNQHLPWRAFDNVRVFPGQFTGDWATPSDRFPAGFGDEWIQIDFGTLRGINYYDVWNRRDWIGQSPTAWDIMVSQDGVQWTTIDTRNNIVWETVSQVFRFIIPFVSTRFCRMRIRQIRNAGWHLGLAELEFGFIDL